MIKTIPLKQVVQYSSDRISIEKVTVDNYVKTDNMLQNKLGIIKANSLPPQDANMTAYYKQNILIGNIRPYLKKIWFADKDGGNSADVLTLHVNREHIPEFVYYALYRDDFFSHMMKGSKGTKMPRGDKTQIMNFIIPDISKDNEEKIANVLSSLDAKIEFNNKINNELEAMAQTLYNYWFVQFDFPNENGKPYKSSGGKMVYNNELKKEIPKGWEIKTISDLIGNYKGGDWGKEQQEGNYTEKVSCIRGADINGLNGISELKAPERFILEKNTKKILNTNDVIVEISGGSPTQSTGRLTFVIDETLKRFNTPVICSNFCKSFSLQDSNYLYTFIYTWNMLYDNRVLFGWEGKTSGLKNLLFDSFVDKYLIVVPDEKINNKFFDKAHAIHKMKQKNLQQNQELSKLRDWLLPMLMNGQVKAK